MRHGVGLLANDSDANRRLALIAIDNAVELMLKTYIDLPKRITGLTLTRKQRAEISSAFPSMLDGLEQHAPDRMVGIDLGEIEWFHRLRNNLYHNGNGLTVERQKVEIYAELAASMFTQLFDTEIDIGGSRGMARVGEFISIWTHIERRISELSNANRLAPALFSMSQLRDQGVVDSKTSESFIALRLIRNAVVHTSDDHSKLVTGDTLKAAKTLLVTLEKAEKPE